VLRPTCSVAADFQTTCPPQRGKAMSIVKDCKKVLARSSAYFAYNTQNADGRNVVYANFPANHVWKIREKVWSTRQRGEKVVG